jgi:hypothetical protein
LFNVFSGEDSRVTFTFIIIIVVVLVGFLARRLSLPHVRRGREPHQLNAVLEEVLLYRIRAPWDLTQHQVFFNIFHKSTKTVITQEKPKNIVFFILLLFNIIPLKYVQYFIIAFLVIFPHLSRPHKHGPSSRVKGFGQKSSTKQQQ